MFVAKGDVLYPIKEVMDMRLTLNFPSNSRKRMVGIYNFPYRMPLFCLFSGGFAVSFGEGTSRLFHQKPLKNIPVTEAYTKVDDYIHVGRDRENRGSIERDLVGPVTLGPGGFGSTGFFFLGGEVSGTPIQFPKNQDIISTHVLIADRCRVCVFLLVGKIYTGQKNKDSILFRFMAHL